jgi:hypothetical protein
MVWKPIKGYEGSYEVSNHGDVRSVDRINAYGRHQKERILKQSLTKGYAKVGLYREGVLKWHLVHRLVAEAFLGECPFGCEVNHIDEDRLNNCAENLEYTTHADNVRYGHGNRRRSESNINHPKLSVAVKQLTLSGECVDVFPSQAEASRQTGIMSTHIGDCCRGQRRTAGGFRWCPA